MADALKAQGEWEDTYLVFTSDHGYHLGQFGMPYDMRSPYEFDIRIPLLVKGPGISKNKTVTAPENVLTVDFAPTFLNMAGVEKRKFQESFDGESFLAKASCEKGDEDTHRDFLIEYEGEGNHLRIDAACSEWDTGDFYTCYEEFGCRCIDVKNNSYTCLRSRDSIFCQFRDNENFEEFYELKSDPLQLRNAASSLDRDKRRELNEQLLRLSKCRGSNCRLRTTTSTPSDRGVFSSLIFIAAMIFIIWIFFFCIRKQCEHPKRDVYKPL